ncbi:MAG: FAD-binding protein, partial [Acutalibacteraceae bacterium]|nr:FAD-binding protein [Acutalibacteraceae bacterium]
GIGRVYKYTTNSAIATGDGIAFARRLGAEIMHLDRIQFHPTAFAADKDRERFLISEAVRGEGAVLLNCYGERFAHNYDSRGELAPRDVVSEAIVKEALRTKSESFYLDITHKGEDFVKERFPMIYENCLAEGVDITKQRIPVFPCQHYLMGGIDVDLNGKTSVDRLYAAGECSHTGVHGANRLASNSLLEALVFSRRAALDIMKDIKAGNKKTVSGDKPTYSMGTLPLPKGIRTEIRSTLQDAYFVLKKPEKFEESFKRFNEILTDLETNDYMLTSDYIEAKSLATVAQEIMLEVTEKQQEDY